MRTLSGLALLVALVSGCFSSKEDAEMLEVSGENNAQVMNNQEAEFGQQQGLLNEEGTFEQGNIEENSSIAGDTDPALNEGGGVMNDTFASGGTSYSADGGVVRYVVRDQVSVHAQADASSAVVGTMDQGEVLLVTIDGTFAQSAAGFIAVTDLAAEMQPRSFSGNDWH